VWQENSLIWETNENQTKRDRKKKFFYFFNTIHIAVMKITSVKWRPPSTRCVVIGVPFF